MTTLATTTKADSATTTSASQNGIQSLLSQAESVISSVYPEATITDLDSLTWPTIVIGGETVTVPTSSSSSSATSTSSSSSSLLSSTLANANPVQTSAIATPSTNASSGKSHDPSDKRLGIILGVVLGCIALFLFLFLVWFLHRRNKKTGSFFKRRVASPSDEEINAWRNPNDSDSTEKYTVVGSQPTLLQPAMAAHGLYGSRSWTHDDGSTNPRPAYRPDDYQPYGHGPAELAAEGSIRNIDDNEHTPELGNRPSTPFSPAEFAALARGPVSPIDNEQRRGSFWPQRNTTDDIAYHSPESTPPQQTHYQNPFASHEDYDDDDDDDALEPPTIPSRSPRRRSSPQTFFPSGDELNQFDFGLDQAQTERRGSNRSRWD